MIKILTVCLGNICRSPIAEEVLRVKCSFLGLDAVVDSAGTADYHSGAPPDARMIQTALNFGYHIQGLKARQFKTVDFDNFDYIFAMDKSNLDHLMQLAKSDTHRDKLFSFQDFAGVQTPDFVPDPYYGTDRHFIETFQIVETSSESIAQKLKKLHA